MDYTFELPDGKQDDIDRISNRFNIIDNEIIALVDKINALLPPNKFPKRIEYLFEGRTANFITDAERAQQLGFVSRYEQLPVLTSLTIAFKQPKLFYFKEYHTLKMIINEYRSIIINCNDSVYYRKIGSFCKARLKDRDFDKRMKITVLDGENNITEYFNEFLLARKKGIDLLVNNSEFDYLYNGVLQHSDLRFADRYLDDYTSGEINYILLKHCILCGHIKELLFWHYRLCHFMHYPKIGSL